MLGALANNTLLQIVVYNLVGQLTGAVLGPYAQAITNQVNAATPLLPLSPAELALAVVRNELTEAEAAGQAAMSGVDSGRFHVLTRITGNAPGAGDLAVALRRGLVDEATYLRGIRQGNLRDEWADLVRQLAVQQPSPQAMLEAYLEGQVDEAEARAKYAALGGDPDYFDVLYHTQGSAPSPLEAAEAARRGIIPWDGRGPDATSFEQAFLEGPWRNKWMPVYRELTQYLPPPRTITAMYREGSLTRERAAELLAKQGLTPDLIEGYLTAGSNTKTAKTRDLAQSTILELWRDRLVSRDDVTAMLEALGYDATEAGFILAIEDMRLSQHFLSLAVSRVHTLYVGHKIDRATTISTLGRLGVDAAGQSDLLAIWDWERAAAVKKGYLDPANGRTMLVELGYTPHDAWLYLSVHTSTLQPDEPPPDAIGPGPGP
jgi:hypothetical protein